MFEEPKDNLDSGPEVPASMRQRAAGVSYKPASPKSLDSEVNKALHRKLMGFYTQELDRQYESRIEQAIDHDFYDGEQWAAEDRKVLLDRAQKPLVFNVIATTIDWITGSEKRTRTDFKVIARRKEGGRAAESKTQLLKYLADVNDVQFHRSRAFEDATKGGIGWLEDQMQDEGDGEPVYSRYESWRNMLWDSTASTMDLSDARYIFRSKWVDLDVAISWFPKRAQQLKLAAMTHTGYSHHDDEFGDEPMDYAERAADQTPRGDTVFDYTRRRVRLIEAWFKKPGVVPKIRGSEFAGELYDETSRGHQEAIAAGAAAVAEKNDMRMCVAVMTIHDLLFLAPSPYRHNRFPFTPIWCYRRNKDGMPYGVIRRIRDIQDDVNKRASKALHILSTNKTIMDEGAVPDLDEYLEEVSRPDAVIVKKKGYSLEISADRELAPAHLDLMARSIQMIQSVGGVTDENLGRQTNATSGKAIERRQDQGALATAGIFDNLYYARKKQGEKQLSLVEQFFSEEKTFRINNSRGNPVYVGINSGLPEDDITRTKADYVISEDEWRASVREAQTDRILAMLRELAPGAPQLVMIVLDLIIEGMDIANREEIVARIRKETGMRDPDAEEPTPEEMAMEEQKAAAADRAIRMEEATIAEKEASAAQKGAAADAQLATIKRLMAEAVGKNVETQARAVEAALAILGAPAVVPVADVVLQESGFKSRSEEEDEAAVDAQASELEALAAEGAAMQQPPMDPMAPPEQPGAVPMPAPPMQPPV